MYEFTKRAETALEYTRAFAMENNYSYIGTEHILYGLMKESKGIAARILRKQNITAEYIEGQIFNIDGRMTKKKKTEPELTPRAKRVLENSVKESQRLGYNYVGTEHILLGLMQEADSVAVRILIDADVDPEKIFTEIVKIVSEDSPISNIYSKEANNLTPTLDMYSEDLTALVKENKLDNVIGREEELNRIIQTLIRRSKNNPLVIGEAGVGKTTIINGLAHKMYSGEVPKELKNKRLVSLDISGMIAGAKYRGDFEERFKKCIIEAKKAGNVILYIDELRTIIGVGSAEGALDAANILKPYLTRGGVQLIGATTREEYVKYIEKDSALDRRFQVIYVNEPSYKETINIINGIKERYENFHNVEITDQAIEEAVRLSIRYLPDRNLPDKAIDVIDEACSKVKLNMNEKSCENNDAVVNLQKKFLELKGKNKENGIKITKEDIAEVVSKWSKVPMEKLEQDEAIKLKKLEKTLKQRIIGQDEAVSALAKAIKRSRVGIRDPKRPIATFLLTGPTGVGKTELVKTLASQFFDDDSLIKIDMSEYMEAHSVSKLIGSPPGYVGFLEGGQLTEKVRKKPYSIILFDEIEKANEEIYNILLQILDEGRLTDSTGKEVDFKNTICIMTSNIGARNITEMKNIGFVKNESKQDEYEKMKKAVMEEVSKKFSPEFLNRLDDVIVFNKLDKESIKTITKLLLKEVEKRAKVQGINIKFEQSVVDYIASIGFDSKKGARPIKRTIQNKIEDVFADYVINGNLKKDDSITMYLAKNKDEIKIKKTSNKVKSKEIIKQKENIV